MPEPQNRHYTYEEAEQLYPDRRFEVINGEILLMSPPSPTHQRVARNLIVSIGNQMKSKGDKCDLFPAPTGLFFTEEDARKKKDGGVEPDLFVICDYSQIGVHIVGVPKFIAEILSPSSIRNDRFFKMNLYQKHGVPLYWIVDAGNECVEEYVLSEKTYQLNQVYTKENDDKIQWSLENNEYVLSVHEIFE
ncbi:Uma2 family endonuclease [Alicyclobacillus tolerans]|uniref:Uma2 family endonuclease n=1 Tax=Alicyclobacillus tolerans TaxID=90970 RepID=UPI001F298821|nr:Uma2 family endonuclease [Alicyclobacillus tolerans]MCF8564864.1 Uma2 family endonuclease [Alicyclobacillus tolerans]